MPTENELYEEERKLMVRGGKKLGRLTKGGPEDCRFRSHFGAGVAAINDAWERMEAKSLLPDGGTLRHYHYLWALVFLKQYPKNEAALCSLLGSPDPKTARKRIWPFIEPLYELGFYVVSEKK